MKIALCIPTLNARIGAARLIDAIGSQTLRPEPILVVDSASDDGTVAIFEKAGARVHTIDRDHFNHGATRQLGVDLIGDADVIIFMTQDAIPADRAGFERLVAPFEQAEVGAAYGRQLPHPGAGLIEAHARLFNYPEQSAVRRLDDRRTLGIKTAFLSNSFAAYRRLDLLTVGGFPSHLIMGEDTYVAAKLLLAGKKIAYRADARVFHSHVYRVSEEFRRYFDTGVLHAREPWIRQSFGGAEGEGLRFVRSELSFLATRNPLLIPSALIRTVFKWAGFRLGLFEAKLPSWLKRRLSMLRSYWSQTKPGRRLSSGG